MNQEPYATAAVHPGQSRMVVDLSLAARSTFMIRVFTHLLGALLSFTLLEVAIFKLGFAAPIAQAMFALPWLVILGIFMLTGWGATRVAHSSTSKPAQYLALAAYVVIEALIFTPLLFLANQQAGGGMIASAAYVSLAGFAGLAAVAIMSRKDFSFLGAILKWGFLCAIGLMVASAIFGFELGMAFNVAMVAFAGAAILYDTQRIFQSYPEDRYVAASLQLFASVALLFWYVLRIFMSRD
jgi:FtsH-binding integral membrane protein